MFKFLLIQREMMRKPARSGGKDSAAVEGPLCRCSSAQGDAVTSSHSVSFLKEGRQQDMQYKGNVPSLLVERTQGFPALLPLLIWTGDGSRPRLSRPGSRQLSSPGKERGKPRKEETTMGRLAYSQEKELKFALFTVWWITWTAFN